MGHFLAGRRLSLRTVFDSLWSGRYHDVAGKYNHEASVLVGILLVLLTAILGFIASLVNGAFFGLEAPFLNDELYLIWGVHATVISLSLVALSFAWHSIRQLPTTDEIINELIHRLRSLETITFLLFSNLAIGVCILYSNGEFVDPKISGVVLALLLTTFIITTRRFWFVLDILLHQSLDKNVSEFAESFLKSNLSNDERKYSYYIEHFIIGARSSIENDRPEQLRQNLNEVEDLLADLLWYESDVEDDIWNATVGNLLSLHRRSLAEQNPELEKRVISSFYGLALIAQEYDRKNLANLTVRRFPDVLQQGLDHDPNPSIEHLLRDFENIQMGLLGQFERAEDRDSLSQSMEYVDNLIKTHAKMWKIAVEHESRGALGYLNYLLEDVFQFRPWQYRDLPAPGESPDPFNEAHQDEADEYRREVTHLKFASFGWALHLFTEGEISEDFTADIFSTYVERIFPSVTEFSKVYAEILNDEEMIRYWEDWNMQRELEQSYGAATTGMAVNTWLLKFYCTGVMWVANEDQLAQLTSPEDSPFLENDIRQHRLDSIIKMLESYESEYPLEELLSEDPSVEERRRALIDYFRNVKDTLTEYEKKEIRKQPISDQEIDRFENHVNSQLEDCTLRTCINYIGEISKSSEEREFDGFTHIQYAPRRVFVESDIPTHFSSTHFDLIEKYRQFVIDHLELDEREVPIEHLLNALEEVSAKVVSVEMSEVGDIIREDDRSERVPNNQIHSYTEFAGIPVVRENTQKYAALALFDGGFEYFEPLKESPISVKVTPGEKVDDMEGLDLSGEVEDWVEVEFTYHGIIKSQRSNGVLFRSLP